MKIYIMFEDGHEVLHGRPLDELDDSDMREIKLGRWSVKYAHFYTDDATDSEPPAPPIFTWPPQNESDRVQHQREVVIKMIHDAWQPYTHANDKYNGEQMLLMVLKPDTRPAPTLPGTTQRVLAVTGTGAILEFRESGRVSAAGWDFFSHGDLVEILKLILARTKHMNPTKPAQESP